MMDPKNVRVIVTPNPGVHPVATKRMEAIINAENKRMAAEKSPRRAAVLFIL